MSTNSHIRSSAAAVSLAAAALLAAQVRPAAAQQQLQASTWMLTLLAKTPMRRRSLVNWTRGTMAKGS